MAVLRWPTKLPSPITTSNSHEGNEQCVENNQWHHPEVHHNCHGATTTTATAVLVTTPPPVFSPPPSTALRLLLPPVSPVSATFPSFSTPQPTVASEGPSTAVISMRVTS
ncbi:hypothetical protein Fot_11725 [Forsythia ovata]|uniref:Uncharacterized protein n=1 Tax=Forsythia ovata TaxID=205694 RepID=A0ABD1WL60_9LAMI